MIRTGPDEPERVESEAGADEDLPGEASDGAGAVLGEGGGAEGGAERADAPRVLRPAGLALLAPPQLAPRQTRLAHGKTGSQVTIVISYTPV